MHSSFLWLADVGKWYKSPSLSCLSQAEVYFEKLWYGNKVHEATDFGFAVFDWGHSNAK